MSSRPCPVFLGMSTLTERSPKPAAGRDRPPTPALTRHRLRACCAGWCWRTFIVILNETIMINAIPRLMGEFEVSARAAQWLSTAFMLTMAVVIPVTGWFLQRVTTRPRSRLAMVVFCTGTLLAALAPAFPVLLAARVVQASGTAVMMPLLMTTLMTVVPEHDRGRVMGNVTLAMSVAPALGPAVSGVVLQSLSWRWIFAAWCCRSRPASRVLGLRRLTQRRRAAVAGTVDWFSVRALRGRLRQPRLRPEPSSVRRDAPPRSPYAAARRSASLAIAVFVWRQLVLQRTDTPLLDLRTLTLPHLHRSRSALMSRRVHGDAGLDDPAAAVPAERPRPDPAADRPAA